MFFKTAFQSNQFLLFSAIRLTNRTMSTEIEWCKSFESHADLIDFQALQFQKVNDIYISRIVMPEAVWSHIKYAGFSAYLLQLSCDLLCNYFSRCITPLFLLATAPTSCSLPRMARNLPPYPFLSRTLL